MVEIILAKLESVKAKILKVEVTRALYTPLSDALSDKGYTFNVKMSKAKIIFEITTKWIRK